MSESLQALIVGAGLTGLSAPICNEDRKPEH